MGKGGMAVLDGSARHASRISLLDQMAIDEAMGDDEAPPPADPATIALIEAAETGEAAPLRAMLGGAGGGTAVAVDSVGPAGTTVLMEAASHGHGEGGGHHCTARARRPAVRTLSAGPPCTLRATTATCPARRRCCRRARTQHRRRRPA
eukprot:COSAG06_NODE_1815_length_8303_cov_3.031936_2_plen_149_part_00